MTEIEKTQPPQEIKVTSENLPELRQRIGSLREQKGREPETLKLIRSVRKEAIRLGEHEDVVNLYWEEYLVGKHIAMEARDKGGLWNLPLKAKGILEGFRLMRNSANNANKYIDKHHVENCRPRSGRFLGEIALFKKNYDKAIGHFEKSIELFEQSEDWPSKVNALEISGFLAEALILSGKTEEGIDVAKKTFAAYDEEDGVKLKENDYYTWAVWKSGCPIKTWQAILAKRATLDEPIKKALIHMLDFAEQILVIPDGQKTWGDKNFEFRKNEIKAIRKSAGI